MRFTEAADGDLRVTRPVDDLAVLRERLVALPWTWLHQVHRAEVVVVDEPGQHAGDDADAAVTDRPGAVLAIHTADCVPVALLATDLDVVGAVHAGWRGVEAGVVEATVGRLRQEGARDLHAVLGPCIHAECYEFGADELDRMADRYGPAVRAVSSDGRPALDMPAVVRAALVGAGVAGDDVDDVDICTACDRRFFSHRARGDVGRQAMLVWMDGPGVGDGGEGS